jgi:hypothetical protein
VSKINISILSGHVYLKLASWFQRRCQKYIPIYLILVITAIFERGQMFDTILKEFHPRTIPPSFASKRFCSFRGVDNVNERCKPMSTNPLA